ncbi:hypothetical protein QOZ80_4BG0347530 [Eleusine coracana subsp. coracana]|nr:hypothetical protein QOZ80_4BG0347530 [Eleusine coracana subsp. coracana]
MATWEGELHGIIIIVGGGICGLATAVALHRKGIRSLVLERAESLRATGAGISIHANGWRALDQLKIGDELRKLAVPLSGMDKREVHGGRTIVVVPYRSEVRCLKRSDLVETLAKQLPAGYIRFGCQVEDVSLEPITRFPIVSTSDGSTIKAKLVIGCDGAKSVVAKLLSLKATKYLPTWAARSLTTYPGGHHYGNRFQILIGNGINFRLIPIDDKLVCFNAHMSQPPKECIGSKDVNLIQQATLQMMQGFPEDVVDLVRRCDITSLSFTQLCYRAPWHMILEKFHEGMVTVAGDAMHVMGPFLGQGGSCGLEDAIVLARCLAKTMSSERINDTANDDKKMVKSVNEGIRLYVKERRWRIVMLSLQTFLTGSLNAASSRFRKMFIRAVMVVLFRSKYRHYNYDCGSL